MNTRLPVLIIAISLCTLACSAGSLLPGATATPLPAAPPTATDAAATGADPDTATLPPADPAAGDPTLATSLTGACANTYFPIVEGLTWHYTIASAGTPTVNMWISYSNVTENGFTRHQQVDDVLYSEIAWVCTGDGLIASEYANLSLALTGYSFTTLSYEGAIIPPQAQMVPGGSWFNFFDVNGSFPTDIGDAVADMQISETSTVEAAEAVSVPYGDYDSALRVNSAGQIISNLTIGGISTGEATINVDSVNWYVEGIGLVRQEAISEGYTSLLELVAVE